jgi:hypothetical protein
MTAVHKQLVLSRVFVFLIFLLAALSTVCCYGYSSGPSASSGGVVSDLPPGTPQWAIHVWPPHVDRAAPLETYRARLIAELGGAELPYQYISAEQIAALAINEFTAGHEWDAALLLSIASYRYHQTAIHAYRLGVASATEHAGQINLDAYAKLIGSEVQAYNRMYFVDELTRFTMKTGPNRKPRAAPAAPSSRVSPPSRKICSIWTWLRPTATACKRTWIMRMIVTSLSIISRPPRRCRFNRMRCTS